MPSLCLNAIVRNESACIVRMLDSVKPYICALAILDTGSEDNTVELIEQWCRVNGIKGLVGRGAFVNFSQARNQALDMARSWRMHLDAPEFGHLLLCDADMELRVDASADPFADLVNEAYMLQQKAGTLVYNNVRLLSVYSRAKYVGVTHEYLAVDGGSPQILAGAHFIDHADGANRAGKYERDIALLTEALKEEPDNARYWFYLANTYKDKGDRAQAVSCYQKRIALGGWDEEVWNAWINLANQRLALGDEDGFVHEALAAYQFRPRRAEPLLGLATHFREKGQNAAAMVFIEKGINIPQPDDILFLDTSTYQWGFRNEYAICGYYQEETRQKAFEINNGLALDPSVPDFIRHRARRDMVFYLRPLAELAKSARYTRIGFAPAAGYTAMNPCVTNKPSGDLECLLRTVNYRIDAEGRYMIGDTGCWDAPIKTQNWLLDLNRQLRVQDFAEVSWVRPAPVFPQVVGLEDMRVFWHRGERHFIACVREQSERGVCEQWHGYLRRVHETGGGCAAAALETTRLSDGVAHEKNWAPMAAPLEELRYMYRLGHTLDEKGAPLETTSVTAAVENISGGSPYIPMFDGWLSVVHEAIVHPSHGRRVYQHRFAYIDRRGKLTLSMPFVFHAVQIEFAAGLARHPDGESLVISFGVRDAEAWLAMVKIGEVGCVLGL